MSRALAALVAVLLSGCGRVHLLEDGQYALTPTQVLRDDCGLASQGLLEQATLVTAGDSVTMRFTAPASQLAGTYRISVEQMTLDGTIANYATVVRGEACLLDFVTLHLDTVTTDATHFTGAMSVTYYAPQADACVCKLWFDFTAARVGAS
jgi:hypothetical protein